MMRRSTACGARYGQRSTGSDRDLSRRPRAWWGVLLARIDGKLPALPQAEAQADGRRRERVCGDPISISTDCVRLRTRLD